MSPQALDWNFPATRHATLSINRMTKEKTGAIEFSGKKRPGRMCDRAG